MQTRTETPDFNHVHASNQCEPGEREGERTVKRDLGFLALQLSPKPAMAESPLFIVPSTNRVNRTHKNKRKREEGKSSNIERNKPRILQNQTESLSTTKESRNCNEFNHKPNLKPNPNSEN